MDLLPSLCAAMMRAGGDSLVLREGSPPHVMSGTNRHDVARAVLSHNAVEALLLQIFSETSRRVFLETGRVSEVVQVAEPSLVVTAEAERVGTELRIELVRQQPVAVEPPSLAATEPDLGLRPAIEATTAMEPLPTPEDLSLTPADLQLAAPASLVPEESPAPVRQPPRDWAAVLALAPPSVAFHAVAAESSSNQLALEAEPGAEPEPVHMHVSRQDPPRPEPVSVAMPPTAGPPVSDVGVVVATGLPVDLSQGDLFSWITSAAALGGTALYLRADAPVLARVDGKMTRVQSEVLTASAFARACAGLDGGADHAWQRNTDGSWTRGGGSLGRTTCREFSDDLGAGLVVFLQTPPPALSLHRLIPRKVKGACDGDGLVVVAASTPGDVVALGAATADWAGQRRGGYVIALRPAGTTRPHISGDFVSQREFSGSDAEIASAVHAAAAESPDVLLVAAPPSDAAMREAVHAADAGRLVIVAVLAQTSVQALRVLGGRVQAGGAAPNRLALATAFRAAFSHRVLRRLRGGQTLVQDLILGTSEVSTLLASGDLAGITRLQRSAVAGMSTVDGALARAVTRGHLSLRQAAGQAVDRGHLVTSVRAARRARANRTPLANDSDAAMLGCDDLFVPMGAKAFAGRHHAFAG